MRRSTKKGVRRSRFIIVLTLGRITARLTYTHYPSHPLFLPSTYAHNTQGVDPFYIAFLRRQSRCANLPGMSQDEHQPETAGHGRMWGFMWNSFKFCLMMWLVFEAANPEWGPRILQLFSVIMVPIMAVRSIFEWVDLCPETPDWLIWLQFKGIKMLGGWCTALGQWCTTQGEMIAQCTVCKQMAAKCKGCGDCGNSAKAASDDVSDATSDVVEPPDDVRGPSPPFRPEGPGVGPEVELRPIGPPDMGLGPGPTPPGPSPGMGILPDA